MTTAEVTPSAHTHRHSDRYLLLAMGRMQELQEEERHQPPAQRPRSARSTQGSEHVYAHRCAREQTHAHTPRCGSGRAETEGPTAEDPGSTWPPSIIPNTHPSVYHLRAWVPHHPLRSQEPAEASRPTKQLGFI